MITIRGYLEKDKERLQLICEKTTSWEMTPKKRQLLLALYNDYYTQCEPQNIFVAVDEEDKAVGYILSASDFKSYKKMYCQKFLPVLRSISPMQAFIKRLSFLYDKMVARKYPAHLHIDILDGYQRQGIGARLMNALVEKLKQDGIAGLSLGVSAKNKKGRSFYEKYGFTHHDTLFGLCRYVLALKKEESNT